MVAERSGGFGGVEWHFITAHDIERPEFLHAGYFDAVFYDSFLVDLDFAVAVADLQEFYFSARASAVVGQAALENCGSEGSQSLLILLECILGADGKHPAEVIRFSS